jgi:hypothetical protein
MKTCIERSFLLKKNATETLWIGNRDPLQTGHRAPRTSWLWELLCENAAQFGYQVREG